jgi:hypothetical protein
LLASDPRALDVLEDEVLERAAGDADLAQLCMHVLAARAFADPDHVERLAAKLDAASKSASVGPARGELRAAIAMGRGYRSLTIAAPCPAPLERALGLFGRLNASADRALFADLERDLRAQPAPYLAWADEVAAAAPALIDTWLIRFRSLSAAPAEPIATPRSDALIREATAAIERDALRFLPMPRTNRTLYRRHVRPRIFAAIVEPTAAVTLRAVAASAQSYAGGSKRVLEQFACDSALVLLDQLLVTSASRGSSPETIARR